MQKNFSYPLQIDELNNGQQTYNLKANKEELQILAQILKVKAVNSFSSELKLNFQKKRGILEINGKVKANILLTSVITLEDFDKDYNSDFTLIYDTNASYDDIKELDEDINTSIPDIIYDGKIDLIDISIEQLALILDDHPRKEGEEFSSIIEDTSPIKNNPFAVLEKLKK